MLVKSYIFMKKADILSVMLTSHLNVKCNEIQIHNLIVYKHFYRRINKYKKYSC